MKWELRGFDQLDRRLRALPDKVERKVMRTALRSTANKVKRRIAAATPRGDSRPLNAHQRVTVNVKSTNKQAEARIRYKGRTGALMRFYDQGNKRQTARPFFDAAIAGYEQEALKELETALEREVTKAEA